VTDPRSGPNPAIVFPSVRDVWPDFGFVSGAFATDSEHWNGVGGVAPTIVTGEGEQLGSVVRFNKGAGNATYMQLNSIRYTPNLYTGTGLTSYYLVRLKAKTQAASPSILMRQDYYTSGGAFISSGTSQFLYPGTDFAADNAYRVFLMSAGTIPSNAAGIGGVVGFTAADGSSCDLYMDWICQGFVLDFAALGPSAHGAFIEQRMPLPRVYERTKQNAIDGTPEVQLWNAGWRENKLKTTPLDDAAGNSVLAFVGYATRGAPYSIMLNPADLTSGFLSRAMISRQQAKSGLRQIAAGMHVWEWASEEVA